MRSRRAKPGVGQMLGRTSVFAVCWVTVSWVLGASAASVQMGKGEDERSFWHWRHEGLSIRLTQLQPDQVRAFFIARGIERTAVERLAATCLFQMELYNDGAHPTGAAQVPLAQWLLKSDTVERNPMLVNDWLREWKGTPITKSAQIAFRWALFPAEQIFHAGDRNWGMLSTGLDVGAEFDLDLKWRWGGEPRSSRIDNIRCAGER